MAEPKKTCGDCSHFRQFHGQPNGECYFLPPTVFATGYTMRPKVRASDMACGQHAAIEAGAKPAVKEKVRSQR